MNFTDISKMKRNVFFCIASETFYLIIFFLDFNEAATCNDVITTTLCSSNICLISCSVDSSCFTIENDVWGTVEYEKTSKVCKAALHDLRISFWDKEQQTCEISIHDYYEDFQSSYRYGIKTLNKKKEDSIDKQAFEFTSSRISEPIYNIMTVQENFLTTNGIFNNQQLECYSDEVPAGKKIVVKKYQGNFSEFIEQTNDRNIFLNNTDLPQYISCSVSETILSNAITYGNNIQDFTPEVISKTVNLEEPVKIVIKINKPNNIKPYIIKDGDRLENSQIPFIVSEDNIIINITSAKLYHNGLYSVIPEENQMAVAATTRLIVRVCAKDKYGHKCDKDCPHCINGGVCHDITGICICPPMYYGYRCELVCSFDSENPSLCKNSIIFKNSKGKLICLPDPYGCTCAPGYYGIDCNKECPNTNYGINCHERCGNCLEETICNHMTGECPSKCKPGYKKPFCKEFRPYFEVPPEVSYYPDRQGILIVWDPWKRTGNNGEGPVVGYITLHKILPNGDWQKSEQFYDDGRITTYSHVIENVLLGRTFEVRILVVDPEGDDNQIFSPSKIIILHCIAPTSQPGFIVFDKEYEYLEDDNEFRIKISWTKPSEEVWNCDNISFNVSVIGENSNSSFVTDKTFIILNVKPCMKYNIYVLYFNSYGYSKPWFKAYTSPAHIPDAVENLSRSEVENFKTTLTWSIVEYKGCKNEMIKVGYEITVKMIKWNHDCENIIPIQQFINVTTNIFTLDIKPSAFYEIEVRAKTLEEFEVLGKIKALTLETPESVPNGVVTEVKTLPSVDNITIIWQPPDCTLQNGKIVQYKIGIKGVETWNEDTGLEHIEKNFLTYVFEELQPYSKYNIYISAMTMVGPGLAYEFISMTESTAPNAPENTVIYCRSSDSLWLAWKDSFPPRGQLQQYDILYGIIPIEFKPVEIGCHSGKQFEGWKCKRISNLMEHQSYNIQIRATNRPQKVGPYSEAITSETKVIQPKPPSDINLMEKGENFLDMSWIGPFFLNGNLTGYKIKYKITDSFLSSLYNIEKEQIIQDGEATQFKWEELQPGTEYMIFLYAINQAGESEPLTGGPYRTNLGAPQLLPPEVINNKENTVTLQLRIDEKNKNKYSTYYVIVIKASGRLKRQIPEIQFDKLTNFFNASNRGDTMYIAGKLDSEHLQDNSTFVVGTEVKSGTYSNPPLKSDENYYFAAGSEIIYNNERKFGAAINTQIIKVNGPIVVVQNGATGIGLIIGIVVGVILLLLLILILFVILCRRKKKKAEKKKTAPNLKSSGSLILNNNGSQQSINQENYIYGNGSISQSMVDEVDDAFVCDEVELQPMENIEFEHPKQHFVTDRENWEKEKKQTKGDFKLPKSFGSVSIPELPIYTSEMKAIEGFKSEYKVVPMGELAYCHEGRRLSNKSKNRYNDLLPYDHSRVRLEPTEKDDECDYINANYIDGYQGEKTYIATQGPLPETINDFWRMVWQDNVSKIVMLTNVSEDGELKCEQYWPLNTSTMYGDIKVTLNKTETFANYEIRTFILEKNGDEQSRRVVSQYQFTAWPDHGVPMQPTSLVDFYKKVKNYLSNTSGPVLVHCSGGIGRTGTFILLDTLIDQAQAEGAVDVVHHLAKARQQRMNLIPTLEQYMFLYDALIETLQARNTTILCSEFSSYYKAINVVEPKSGYSFLEEEFQILEAISPKLRESDCRTAMLKENYHRNRFLDIIPDDQNRVHLWSMGFETRNTYINAVSVNSHLKRNAYLATQMPVPHTPIDFWRMLYDHKCQCIVMLNQIDLYDPSCTQYWPHYGTKKYDIFNVTLVSTLLHKDVVTRTFRITNVLEKQKPAVEVKQFHLYDWKNYQTLPPTKESLFQIVDMIDEWQQKTGNNPITIHCMNGVTATGLLCAFLNIRERILTDQEIDIFLDVKAIRQNRPHFIINFTQYAFLYEITEDYLKTFQIYASNRLHDQDEMLYNASSI